MREDRIIATRLVVRGRGLGARYGHFAEERLRRYGLEGGVEAGHERAEIVARGPAALVDMLEVACLLGPAESLVESCTVEAGTSLAYPDPVREEGR